MILRAQAKINVSLHIRGKLPSGMHEIDSLMVPLELHDDISLESADEILVEGLDLAPGDNLAYKAATLLRESFGVRAGARILITKRIPIGAGLGGGSSDAAAVLRGLNQLWDIGLNQEKLRELGAKLGADVPFFIDSVPAHARGFGEKITPVAFPRSPVLLALPSFSVSTAWAYGAYDAEPARDAHNDFFPVIARTRPEIIDIRDALVAHGATLATLSGSGSALFGIFPSEEKAREASLMLPCASILTSTA